LPALLWEINAALAGILAAGALGNALIEWELSIDGATRHYWLNRHLRAQTKGQVQD